MLDEEAKAHPFTYWWLKADGADVVGGLCESVRGEWSGDIDLADGNLKRARNQYLGRIRLNDLIGKDVNRMSLLPDFEAEEQRMTMDSDYVTEC